jgi:hypothetical protein
MGTVRACACGEAIDISGMRLSVDFDAESHDADSSSTTGQRALSAAELADVESQSILDITWPMEAAFHQCLHPVLACGAMDRGDESTPLKRDVLVGWQARLLTNRLISAMACLSSEAMRTESASTKPSSSASGRARFT